MESAARVVERHGQSVRPHRGSEIDPLFASRLTTPLTTGSQSPDVRCSKMSERTEFRGFSRTVGSFKLDMSTQPHDPNHAWRVGFRPLTCIHQRKRAAYKVVRLRSAFEIGDPPVGLGGFDAKDSRRGLLARLARPTLASTHRKQARSRRRIRIFETIPDATSGDRKQL